MENKNFLCIILTSSKFDLLIRCIKSVIIQYPVSFKYTILVNVNTKNDSYYNKVINEIPKLFNEKIEIIRTESNGYPGKGHNSCIQLFKDRKEYNYFTMIDGDDLYYPCAFQRFEKYLKKYPNMDLLHMMLNDRVHFDNNENYNYRQLLLNYKLISAFDNIENWWKTHKMNSPYIGHFADNKTPSRILLCSRNIFNTTIPIRYSEEMKLYDDYIAFLSFYEAELRKEIKTYSCSDTYIYLYNSLNDNSASYKFHDREYEQNIWDKEKDIYNNVKNDNWNIKNLPYAIIDIPNNFNTFSKLQFIDNYVIQYEMKKNIDRLNELKKLNSENKKDLEKIEFILLYLIKSGLDTIDNIKLLINFYIEKKDLNHAFYYIFLLEKKSPTYDIYKYIFDILYKFNLEDRTIKYINILKRFKINDKELNIKINNVYNNEFKNKKYYYFKENNVNIGLNKNKKTLIYSTGFSGEYNGKNYGSKNVYGSEIAAIKICEKLSKFLNVIILCETNENICHNNVFYINHNFFKKLRSKYQIDYFIISRFISLFLDLNLSEIDNLYLFLHDSRPHNQFHDTNLPLIGLKFYNNIKYKFKKIFCVSQWQINNLKQIYKMFKVNEENDKFEIIGNGIDTNINKNQKFENKDLYKFVYTSNPNRGLLRLCEIIVILQKKYKDISLDIYFSHIESIDIINYIKKYNFINFHGKVSNDQIFKILNKSTFWIYPNEFSHETFCIACLEAMNNKNVVITRDFSALPELVKNKSLLIPENLQSNELVKYCVFKIDELLQNKQKILNIQNQLYTESLKYDWEIISKKLLNLL